MKPDYLMIHYGELSTKGNNRRQFIEALTSNIKARLKGEDVLVKGERDHCYVHLLSGDNEGIISKLQEVPGIARISLVNKCGTSIEEIKSSALASLSLENGKTFKIDVKRSDKSYSLSSYDATVAIADFILENTSLKVDLHHYDILLKINIREDAAYISCREYKGLGGYPLGMGGRALMLLSGGIDSPVASYLLLRRGIRIDCLHFASPPYTSSLVIDKLKDILAKLNVYQPMIKLHVVPFTKIQEKIYEVVPEPYCITIMRRMMLRLAEMAAKKNKCLCLATGESVGQVASQTLDSLLAINEVTSYPILRPLATVDKTSIIELAEKIGTYEISIRPYEDCCTIFKPKKPKTKPKVESCLKYESKYDFSPLLTEAIENIKTYYIE